MLENLSRHDCSRLQNYHATLVEFIICLTVLVLQISNKAAILMKTYIVAECHDLKIIINIKMQASHKFKTRAMDS
jgi:hypothetical protein